MFKNTVYIMYQRNPLVWVILLFLSGILLSTLYSDIFLPVIISVIFIIGFNLAKRNEYDVFIVLLISLLLGWGWASYHQIVKDNVIQRVEEYHNKDIQLIGVIKEAKTTNYGMRLQLQNVCIKTLNQNIMDDFRLLLYLKKDHHIHFGDTLEIIGKFKKITPVQNPGEFDYRSWAHRQKIYGKIRVTDERDIAVRLSNGKGWANRLESFRNGIRSHLERSTDGKTTGMLLALILGDKSDVDPELRDSFIETGVIHVLAVSGLHVGYILLILMILTSMLRIPWGWDRIVIILGLIGYVLLTGGKPSVLRASIMAAFYVIAPIVNRPRSIWNIIAASSMIILIVDPQMLFDLGFQLSYSAVISIVYFYNLIEKNLPKKLKPSQISNPLISNTWSLFLVSFSAQIGTLLFTAFYFHRIPVISLIANIFIVPLIGIMVAVGILILTIGWLPYCGSIFGQTAWLNTQIIERFASFFSSLSFSSIEITRVGPVFFIFYGLGIAMLILLLHRKVKTVLIFAGTGLVLLIWSWALKSDETNILFLDVGQGDAAIIQFHDGRTMLIDAGIKDHFYDYGERVVIPAAKYLGIDRFNWAVWSHPHNDHIGGMSSVIETIPVDTVWDTHTIYGSWNYNHLLDLVKEKNIVYHKPHRGDIYRLDHQSYIQILSPDSVWSKGQKNINNISLVMRVVIGENEILFTGDIEEEVDEMILPFKHYLNSDVLKVAHHGSITSTTVEDLKYIQPKIAVISVGEGNKFDHPSDVTIKRLEEAGAEIHRTDHYGALWLRTDGNQIKEIKWH